MCRTYCAAVQRKGRRDDPQRVCAALHALFRAAAKVRTTAHCAFQAFSAWQGQTWARQQQKRTHPRNRTYRMYVLWRTPTRARRTTAPHIIIGQSRLAVRRARFVRITFELRTAKCDDGYTEKEACGGTAQQDRKGGLGGLASNARCVSGRPTERTLRWANWLMLRTFLTLSPTLRPVGVKNWPRWPAVALQAPSRETDGVYPAVCTIGR